MKASETLATAALVGIVSIGVTAGVMAARPSNHVAVAAPVSATALAPERINMTIVPDAILGSNKRTHDAYVPAYITAQAGQKVIVTVYNLDTSPHSFTVASLGLNIIIAGAKNQGELGVTTFSFTVAKAGVYHWMCILPCDNGGVNAWAMLHDGFMAGTITIQR
jgi:plastocyanin